MSIYGTTPRRSSRVKPHKSHGAPDSASAKFDPAAHPIIARHFFGVEPFRQIGDVAAKVVADKKFRRRGLRRSRRLPGPGEIARERALRQRGLHLKMIEGGRP